jgi:hypothetical protein
VIDPQARRRGHPDLSRRLHAAMAGEDAVFAVDQDRIGEAEATNALRDLTGLLARMGSGVARPWPELVKRNNFNKAGGHRVCSKSKVILRLQNYHTLRLSLIPSYPSKIDESSALRNFIFRF